MISGYTNYIIGAAAGIIILLIVLLSGRLIKSRPRKLNIEYFQKRLGEAQKLLASKNTWPLAIINVDKILDEALRRCHYKGKTMGERLVAAQHDLTSNDSVWFAHKLRNRLVHEDNVKLTKRDVKEALLGLRQALKDLGAIKR